MVLSGKTTSLGAKPCPDLFCSGCRARDQRPWQEIGRKIGTQSNEAICGTKVVKPVFGPNYCELVSTKRSVCRSLAYLREQGNGHRKNTDFPTLPHRLRSLPCSNMSIPGMGAELRAHAARSSSRARPPCSGAGGLIQYNTYIE